MEFGKLTSKEAIEERFQQYRAQSRQELLAQIYGNKTPYIEKSSLEHDLSQAFAMILSSAGYDQQSQKTREIAYMFHIDLEKTAKMAEEEREKLVTEKIETQIKDSMKVIDKIAEEELEKCQKNGSNSREANKSKHFEWLDIQTKYTKLRPIFEEILLEKVKLFDSELTRITQFVPEASTSLFNITPVTSTPAQKFKSLDKSRSRTIELSSTLNKSKRTASSTILSRTNSSGIKKAREVQKGIEGQFCNVKIRDKSEFLLEGWGAKEEKEFRGQRSTFKSNLKINQVPVLFQFVKRYTKTVKARENIYLKFEQRERTGITPQELKYLCATSLFLNHTLAKSEKQRIKHNLKAAGPRLISKLEASIADKIIATYREMSSRVAGMRAQYYQQLNQMRHKIRQEQGQKELQSSRREEKRCVYLKYKLMFERLVAGEKMKLKLNPKKLKWVRLFVDRLKEGIGKKVRKGKGSRSDAVFGRLAVGQSHLLQKIKEKFPSTRIIKREDEYSHRLKYRNYIPSERFHYGKLEQTINKLNNIKLNQRHHQSFYRKQLTGGPKLAPKTITVDLSRKKIYLSSPDLIKYVVAIQAKWRAVYYRKRFLTVVEEVREKEKDKFEEQVYSLLRIYPLGRAIDMKAVENRLKRVNMKIDNILKPYIRVPRKANNHYTSFCLNKISSAQLKSKHARNGKIRLRQFAQMVEKNQYSLLKRSGIVVTAVEINQNGMGRGASAMWWAVFHANLELVKKFLQGGGDANSCDEQGHSCLHVAIRSGAMGIVFLLLDYGGDLNARNLRKVSPLFYATKQMLKLLGMQEGVVVGEKDNNAIYWGKSTSNWEQVYGQHHC